MNSSKKDFRFFQFVLDEKNARSDRIELIHDKINLIAGRDDLFSDIRLWDPFLIRDLTKAFPFDIGVFAKDLDFGRSIGGIELEMGTDDDPVLLI